LVEAEDWYRQAAEAGDG